MATEKQFGYHNDWAGDWTDATIRRLAELCPRTLAVMHGSSFSGDAVPLLESLARFYDSRLQAGAPGA